MIVFLKGFNLSRFTYGLLRDDGSAMIDGGKIK